LRRRAAHRRFGPTAAPALCLFVWAAASPALLQAQQPEVGRHTELDAPAPSVESAESRRVTEVIKCFCGGCVNQTLAECTCGFARAEKARLAQALGSGETPEALIAGYVEEHGPQIRIVPERRGLNLVGWAIPYAAALVGLGCLILVLRRWRRRGGPLEAPAEATAGAPAPLEARYRDRLSRDLREIDL